MSEWEVSGMNGKAMSLWEIKEDADISFWHCGRPAYWEGDDVYCSKCQEKMESD